MRKVQKKEILKLIIGILKTMSDERLTDDDRAEAIYEGVFAEHEKEMLAAFAVSAKAYEDKVV